MTAPETMEEDGALQKDSDFIVQDAQPAKPAISILFDVPPYRAYHFYRQFRTASNPNNFLKGVKWYVFV